MGRHFFRLIVYYLTAYKPGYLPEGISLQRWACVRGKVTCFSLTTCCVFSICTGGAEDLNIKILSIFLLYIAVKPAFAHLHGNEEVDKPFNFKSPEDPYFFQAVEHSEEYYGCGGYIRTGFIQTNHQSASAVAGELGCGYQLNNYVKAHVGLLASIDPGWNSDNDQNIQSDFLNQKKDSYLIVGEAVLTLSYQQFEAYLGRQNFDSPHLDMDDLRMIANLYEAYLIEFHYSDDLYFGSGFVRETAGWENGANASQFISIGEALGGTSGGIWTSWVNYQLGNITADVWFYLLSDHLTIFYTELVYSRQLSDILSYNLAVQYDWGSDIGSADLGGIDAQTLGVMAAVTWGNLTFTAAYNKNYGNTGAIASVGGGPFFTSLEDQTLDAVNGHNTEAILLSIEYEINKFVSIGSAVGQLNANDLNQYNKKELNLFTRFNWQEKLTADVMYAVVNDKNSQPDMHQIRAILTYRY